MTTPERCILSLDQGTTSSRAILFNHAGAVLGVEQIPFTQIFPKPGWVEHDPEEIWDSQIRAVRGAIARAGVDPASILSAGITNQRETTVLWDRATGKPVYNAIVWQCRRSAGICAELKAAGAEAEVRARTGLVLDPYFSGTKLAWIFREMPELRRRAERGELAFGTVDSWLLYRLTGRHATDPTNASRTLLYNIHELRWDESLLRLLDIPAAVLPEVLPSSGHFGMVRTEHFGAEVPVTGIAGDQQAALFGHACFRPGDAKNTYGTGCFTLMNTGAVPVASKQGLLTTIAWDLGTAVSGGAAAGAGRTATGTAGGVTYALEGSVFVAGAVIQWLRDQMGLLGDSAESEALARSVPDSGEVYLVPAFVGLGAPYWDPDARGTIVGITRGTTRAHFARAALESMAFQSRDLLAAMERDSGSTLESIKADGGASANSFLMQFQADIMDRRVILPEVGETTALGAAYLSGLASGYWSGLDDVRANWRMRAEFRPEMDAFRRARLVSGWDKAVAAARGYKP